MNRILVFLILAATLVACSGDSYQKKLEDIDSLVSKDMEDSAFNEIKRINISNVNDEESKAYYNLLKTEILFRKEILVKSDSMINSSIAYYTKENNRKMLARSCYIKGKTIYKSGRKKEAIICLKQAESLATTMNDHNIISKIYTSLAYYNMEANEYNLALINAKKAVKYSKRTKDKELQLNSLCNLAVTYGYLDQRDSALFYMKEYIPLLDYVGKEEKAKSLANLGAAYETVDTEKAKQYLNQSIDIEPQSVAYHIFASIYMNENKQEKAYSCLQEALKLCTEQDRRISILEEMFQYKHDTGQYKEASEISEQIIKLKEDLDKQQQKDSIKDAQIAYEMQHVEDTAEQNHRTYIFVITMLIILGIVGTAYYIYRRHKSKTLLQTQQEQIDNYAKEIEEQGKELEKVGSKTKEVAKLKKDIDQLLVKQEKAMEAFQTEKTRIMKEGSKLYKMIISNQNISQWKKAEHSTLHEYYRLTNEQNMNKIEKEYSSLTDNQMLFIIMTNLKKTDQEIMEMTQWQAGNLRKIRSEASRKKK